MAVKTHIALFVERFVAFNMTRYAGVPAMLALFQGLTESELAITPIVNPGNGTRSATVTSISRNFKGYNQSWTPAPADSTLGLYTLQTGTPLLSLAILANQTVPGLYPYISNGNIVVGVVIGYDTPAGAIPEGTAIESVVRGALEYDIPLITTTPGDTHTQLIGDTFIGNLEWVRAISSVLAIPPTNYGQLGSA